MHRPRTEPFYFLPLLLLAPALLTLLPGPGDSYDPPWLLLPLNLILQGVIPLLVA